MAGDPGPGLGPVGAAFYCWDHGTKHGDLRVLGASAYAGPLLGTCLLLALGYGEPGFRLVLAAVLIVGGALLASGDLWHPTPKAGSRRSDPSKGLHALLVLDQPPLRSSPPLYPVSDPSEPTRRWHGTTIATPLAPLASPTARAAAGRPMRRARLA